MKFEVSEQIQTRKDSAAILDALEVQLRKISRTVERTENGITVLGIEASFGSINRHDKTIFQIRTKSSGGVLCVADVTYRPSMFFWVFFFVFLGVMSWVPIIFYLSQRKTVRSAIEDCFKRVRNEFDEIATTPAKSSLEELEKLATLRDRGILSDAEFETKKREFLNSAPVANSLPNSLRPSADTDNVELVALRQSAEKRRVSKLIVSASILLLFITWLAYLLISDRAPARSVSSPVGAAQTDAK